MVCPACGTNNSDDSGLCAVCGYKFRLGHAYNDPKRMTFVNWLSKTKTSKSRITRCLFASIFLIIFVLIILSWIKSI